MRIVLMALAFQDPQGFSAAVLHFKSMVVGPKHIFLKIYLNNLANEEAVCQVFSFGHKHLEHFQN